MICRKAIPKRSADPAYYDDLISELKTAVLEPADPAGSVAAVQVTWSDLSDFSDSNTEERKPLKSRRTQPLTSISKANAA